MEFLREKDENFICALHVDSFHLYMYYPGGSKMGYEFLLGETVLFKAEDYNPSTLHNVDSVESAVNLLGFLTVQTGGAEPEYFKDYTPQQLEWADSIDCEKLGGMVMDFEAGEPEYQAAARDYFEKGFTRDAKVN